MKACAAHVLTHAFHTHVDLTGISSSAVEYMLHWIYSLGKYTPPATTASHEQKEEKSITSSPAITSTSLSYADIHTLATRYQLATLRTSAHAWLVTQLHVRTACDVYMHYYEDKSTAKLVRHW